MYVCVYIQEFGFIFYSEHVKAKKITEKLLKIKGNTFRSTTWSKASFTPPCNVNNFVGIKNSKG